MKRFGILSSIVVVVTMACVALAQRGRPLDPWVADIPAEFQLLYVSNGIPSGDIQTAWTGFPCDNISLQYEFVAGATRAVPGDYTVTFRKSVLSSRGTMPVDGEAELQARAGGVQRFGIATPGEYSGNIDVRTFGKLCHLSKQAHFDTLPLAFPIGVGVNFQIFDVPGYGVTITEKGRTKRVSDRGFGPVELWSLQQAIESAATRIRWSPKQP